MLQVPAHVSLKTLACFLCLLFNQYALVLTTDADANEQHPSAVNNVASNETSNETLRCYFCTSTGDKCTYYQQYVDASEGKNPTLIKNCSAPYDKMCITEQYSINDHTQSYIRDCSDGETFSFTSTLHVNGTYNRLFNLGTNNETACTFDGSSQVCLTKCDTPLCNGPQFDVNRANDTSAMTFLHVLALIWTLLTV